LMGSTYILWLLRSFWGKQARSPWTVVLAVTLTVQIALGAMNVILLAPLWLQITHLFVAELFWVLLVLASADLLLAEQHSSVLYPQKEPSKGTWALGLKSTMRIGSWLMKIIQGQQEGTSTARQT
jgi:hypothetical protein